MPDMRSNTAIKALFAVLFSLLVTGCILSLVGIDFIRSFGGYEHNYDSYQQTERYQGYLQTNGFTAQIEFENAVFDIINPIRYLLPWLCSLSALIAVAVLVYLLYAAGHRPGQSGIVLSTLDRMPLELFILLVAIPFILCIAFGLDLSYYVEPFIYFCLSLPLLIICTLLALLFLLGITVRLKAGGWWRYTLLYLICRTVFRFLRKTIGGLGRGIRNAIGALPSLWKLIAGFSTFTLVNSLLLMAMGGTTPGMVLFWLPLTALVFAWLCHIVLMADRLKLGAERLANGELDAQIDTTHMHGELLQHAENLNNIGHGLARAVEARIKSERMKTELITNVSHDIKTPLTSIINYVDLLKKENFEDLKVQRYLEILESKAQRLKTLTEDVVEASKVSSGNISLEFMNLNFVEMIQQTSGEFEEKFKARNLTEVLNISVEEACIRADGRRTWRILENIYNNAAKYAMEGTRIYADLKVENGQVIFSLKNISQQQLNISADELTERFIRGDISRSTEGSGLGLSIAKTLTELQGGQFQLYLDGDLFKVTVIFPLGTGYF